MKNTEYYERESKHLFDSIYNDGYKDGFEKAKEEFGQQEALRRLKERQRKILSGGELNFSVGASAEKR